MQNGFLTGNLPLDLAVLAWFAAQLIKTLINLARGQGLAWRRVLGSGDMPSSHSAFICAATASIGQICGWRDPLFSLSAVVALVVMYDACNVRWSTGEQAKALNLLLGDLERLPPELEGKRMKEALGHTPFQVLMGALLGVAVGLLALTQA